MVVLGGTPLQQARHGAEATRAEYERALDQVFRLTLEVRDLRYCAQQKVTEAGDRLSRAQSLLRVAKLTLAGARAQLDAAVAHLADAEATGATV